MVSAGTRDHAVWQLFVDWCAASGAGSLPAAAVTLAGFVAANPASRGTQRRRVSVINAAHRTAGYPQPGRAEAVRTLLDSRRAHQQRRRAEAAVSAILRLPDQGWPTTLFARRDAMLLVLTTAGLSGGQIEALRIGDVRADEAADRVSIHCAGGETLCTPADLTRRGVSPVDTCKGWLRIRSIQHHLSNPRFLAAHLRGEPIPSIGNAPASLPVVTRIDRWGATPYLAVPLGAQSVSRIIAAHLAGDATTHQPVRRRAVIEALPEPAAEPAAPAPSLDSATYTRGIAARHRAASDLEGITDTLDDVEDRADRLLAELLQLLDDPTARAV